jgi:hypothetical protein
VRGTSACCGVFGADCALVELAGRRNVVANGQNGEGPPRAPVCYGGEQNPREMDLGRRNFLHHAAGKPFPSRRGPVYV